MAGKKYSVGIVIEGATKGVAKAFKATGEHLKKLNSSQKRHNRTFRNTHTVYNKFLVIDPTPTHERRHLCDKIFHYVAAGTQPAERFRSVNKQTELAK